MGNCAGPQPLAVFHHQVMSIRITKNRAKARLLQPIPLPKHNWQQITTDLVTDLPESEGFMAIVVLMDQYNKMVHFALCTKQITAPGYAKLPVDHVF